jgi:O-antigen biosynthesis protein
MKLSIIIVNYNVKYFLEQCLYSVFKALQKIDGEVIVVDNNSVDGSEAVIRSKFPNVKLIVNNQNLGFSKANNQALKIAAGEYVLLLNPDTVIEESTFVQCISYLDEHPEAGALGPKMIDGKGNYLPESKRGLPTPEVAFYKIFGFTSLFPRSRRFGRYYLGYTSRDEIQEVDVLTGAFMLIRSSVLVKIGLLDEMYFMYGEDIDLSYRIVKAGYKNIYFPKTTIIHYKGESTKKGSLNYVLIFYKAMQVFVEKHFCGNMVKTYSLLMNLAIYFRAALSIFKQYIIKAFPVVLDFIFSYTGVYFIASWWEIFYFQTPDYYSQTVRYIVLPLMVLTMIMANAIRGGYRAPFNIVKAIKGIVYGTLLILVVYALLPVEYRFSRALIIFGAIWAIFSALSVRFLLSLSGMKEYLLDIKKKRRIAIVGLDEESGRIKQLLELSGIYASHIVCVFPGQTIPSEYFTGTLSQLREIIKVHDINEVIFSAKDNASQNIIENMTLLNDTRVDFKIASPESNSVIGSNSKKSSGDLYVVDVNSFRKKKKLSKFRF